MISQTYKELIDSLVEKTSLGKSLWNRTSVKNQYKLILDGGMIVLSYTGYNFGGENLKLDLYNKSGEIIDSLSRSKGIIDLYGNDDASDFELLEKLYKAILDCKEVKINEQLNILMEEINSSDKIGKQD